MTSPFSDAASKPILPGDPVRLGLVTLETEGIERQRFLDAAALAALPTCLRNMCYWPPHKSPEFETEAKEVAKAIWDVAEAALSERDARRGKK